MASQIKGEFLYPIGPASRFVGFSSEWIRTLCDRGEIACLRDAGGRRLIPESELKRVRDRRESRQDE